MGFLLEMFSASLLAAGGLGVRHCSGRVNSSISFGEWFTENLFVAEMLLVVELER